MMFLARHFRSPRQALATDHPPHISVAECLHALESRYLFDAAGVATGTEAAVDAVAQEQAEQAVDNQFNDSGAADAGQASASSPADDADPNDQLLEAIATHQAPAGQREIVFVDTSVGDYQTLIAEIDPSAEVVLLDATRDGVEQIAEVLAGRSGIDAIHIVSHGSQAELQLGTARLTLDSMSGEYADELAAIGQALTDEADILVYGCNFGEGGQGQEAAATLAKTTGADVAASEDATGHATLGGDWDLELRVGQVDSTAALTGEEQANYMGLLATWDVHDDFNPPAYDGNDGSANWNGDWQEVNDDNNSATGLVYAAGGVLNREIPVGGDSTARGLWRGADLSQALNATLSFDHKATVAAVTASTTVDVQVSDDGGMNWVTVLSTSDNTLVLSDTAWVTSSVDISAYATANTQIRLLASSTGVLVLGEAVQFDNVKISYTVNDAPVNTVPGAQSVAEDTPLALGGISVNDANGNLSTVALAVGNGTLTVTLQGGASIFTGANGSAALTLSGSQADINATLATLSYQGSLNYNGADTLTVTSTDTNSASDTDTIAITVAAVNDAPVANADAYAVAEDGTLTVPAAGVLTNDTDIDGDPLGALLVSGPANGALTLNTDGSFTYTPIANFSGTDSFTYRANDGTVDSALAATVTLTVTAVNDAPVANADSGTLAEGSTLSVNLAANDTDADNALDLTSIQIVAGPANGSVVVNGDGTITYTHNGSETAADSFTYTIRDASGAISNIATVTLTVTPVNDAPVITSNGGGATASVSIAENTTAVTTVTATDVDVPAQTLTYSIVGGADQTLFSIDSSTGALIFNTAPDFEAPADANADNVYEVTVQASDGSLTDIQAFSVTVIAAAPASPGPPSAGGGISEGPPSAPGPAPSLGDLPPSEVGDEDSSKTSTNRNTTASDGSPTVSNSRAQPAAVSRVGFRSKQDFSNETSRGLGSKQPVAKQTNAAAANAADVQDAKDPYSTLKADRFLEELNRLRGDMNHQLSLETLALTIGLSVGYAIWLVRGGALLSSLLSSLPAWRWLDPLPVLAHLRDPRDDEEGNEDSLQAVLKNAEARDQSKLIPDGEVVPPAQPAVTGAALSQPDATASLPEKADNI